MTLWGPAGHRGEESKGRFAKVQSQSLLLRDKMRSACPAGVYIILSRAVVVIRVASCSSALVATLTLRNLTLLFGWVQKIPRLCLPGPPALPALNTTQCSTDSQFAAHAPSLRSRARTGARVGLAYHNWWAYLPLLLALCHRYSSTVASYIMPRGVTGAGKYK